MTVNSILSSLVVQVEHSQYVCVRVWTITLNTMTFDLDIWQADSSSSCLGQIRKSRLRVKAHGHRIKNVPFSAMDARQVVVVVAVMRILNGPP